MWQQSTVLHLSISLTEPGCSLCCLPQSCKQFPLYILFIFCESQGNTLLVPEAVVSQKDLDFSGVPGVLSKEQQAVEGIVQGYSYNGWIYKCSHCVIPHHGASIFCNPPEIRRHFQGWNKKSLSLAFGAKIAVIQKLGTNVFSITDI